VARCSFCPDSAAEVQAAISWRYRREGRRDITARPRLARSAAQLCASEDSGGEWHPVGAASQRALGACPLRQPSGFGNSTASNSARRTAAGCSKSSLAAARTRRRDDGRAATSPVVSGIGSRRATESSDGEATTQGRDEAGAAVKNKHPHRGRSLLRQDHSQGRRKRGSRRTGCELKEGTMTKGLMTLGGIAPALPLDAYGQPIPARLSRSVGGELLLKLPQEGRGVQELPRLALGGLMALRAEEGIRSFLSRAAALRTKGQKRSGNMVQPE